MRIELEPQVMRQKVAILRRIEVNERPAQQIVLVDEVAIVHRSGEPHVPLHRDIERF